MWSSFQKGMILIISFLKRLGLKIQKSLKSPIANISTGFGDEELPFY
jgi:hypothetical protein